MSFSRVHGYITLSLLIGLLSTSSLWYITSPHIYRTPIDSVTTTTPPTQIGKYVLIDTTTMEIKLRNGTTTLETIPIITIGKPGSYYETIGGSYLSTYKIPNHFSSIGHVYMPWSVHVFGNFFIHGIPYYPDGTSVSSQYSGGCIRLATNDAKKVYDFVEQTTPIIITQDTEQSFTPSSSTTPVIMSQDMTRFMVAIISLEVLTQDDAITNTNGETTTRRKLLPRLIVDGDSAVSHLYAQSRGETTFIEYMNTKARALGLTNTFFTSVEAPTVTTQHDLDRFRDYVVNYKSYLLTLASSTELFSR